MFHNDNDMVECPYNNTHRMLRKRLQSHLIKCRVHYSDVELKKCPFNITHLVPEPEYAHHAKNCPDRNLITQYKYDAPEQKEEEIPKHAPIECDENWDDTEVIDYNPRLHLEEANVLLRPVGRNPSERKLFIKKERKRLGDDDDSSDDNSKNEAISSRGKRQKYDCYEDDFHNRAVYPDYDYYGRSKSPCSSSSFLQSSRSPSSLHKNRNLSSAPIGWRTPRENSPQQHSYNHSPNYNHSSSSYPRSKTGRTPNNDQYNNGREDNYNNYSCQPHRGHKFERTDMIEAPPPPIISYPIPRTHSSRKVHYSYSNL